MNEIWVYISAAIALIAGIFAIRATVRFDVNEWLRDRREQRINRLRALCPHIRTLWEEGRTRPASAYVSPIGAVTWHCQVLWGTSGMKRRVFVADASILAYLTLDKLAERNRGIQKVTCLSMKLSKAAETQRMSHRGFQSLGHIRVPHSATPAYVVVTSSDLLDTSQEQGIGERDFRRISRKS